MSTILYKFKSSTGFEPISLPGSSARLFDVKRAIVKVNKLDRSTGGGMQLEFDISVKNAMTEEVYDDENMLLPRGTRIIVQRLPAAKGQGLLARIARADAGMASNVTMSYGNKAAASNGFYTIESAREDDEEFVDTNAAVPAAPEPVKDELAALKAVTDQAGDMYRSSTSFTRSAAPNKFGQPGPTSSTGNSFRPPTHQSYQARPNADPELREKERLAAMQTQPKKTRHAPGIPRTFLNIGSSTQASAEGDEDGAAGIKLQPNQIGFQALINRGGGQAVSGPSRKNDLDYALKLTATEIPVEYQCGVCKEVVKNSVIVPWDTEFRPACEMCMRDGLAKSGFVCPLTGLDGQSPDDLIPNNPHRRTVDTFVKGVMDKMDEIIQQQEADEEQERENEAAEALKNKKANEFEGDGLDKGMILRKGIKQAKSRRQSDEFGEDEFGGDVFDVEADDEEEEVEETQDIHTESLELSKKDENTHIASNQTAKEASVDDKSNKPIADIVKDGETSKVDNSSERETTNVETKSNDKNSTNNEKSMGESGNENHQAPSTPSKNGDDDASSVASRRELLKNRAPPAGYQMGPAGSAGQQQNSHGYGGRGGRFQNNYNRGRSNNFHGGRGRFQRYSNQHHSGMGYDSGQGGRGYQAQDGYSNGHDFNDQNFGGPDRPNKRTHSEIGGGQGRHSHNGGRFQGRHQGRWNGDGGGGRGRGRGNFGRGFSDGRFGRGGRGEFRGGFNRGGRGRVGWDHRGRGRYGGRGRF